MWTHDLNKEEWSPISFQSSVVPLPRSELAHVRYQDDFILFGGNELFMIFIDLVQQIRNGCLYLKMLLISYKLEEIVNDFLLIYGGIGASGYSMSDGNSTGVLISILS
jgi:hypothetical protein